MFKSIPGVTVKYSDNTLVLGDYRIRIKSSTNSNIDEPLYFIYKINSSNLISDHKSLEDALDKVKLLIEEDDRNSDPIPFPFLGKSNG